eukprot:TRINITY_DN22561_c0_g2_i1.p1 TRINITY_DN22561_c0_g2~~TRINITY_DN22561_c0_g2_i1.p1  ORF type:complete len:256 (+),score=65.53 TRINITY_DN22561_c0_g2_i1:70-768(+)
MCIRDRNKVGWIGTGMMGAAMCRRLLTAGYQVSVSNRTPEKAAELVAQGAAFATPEEIALTCDVIVLMVGYPSDVEAIFFNQILPRLRSGALLIDHTTSSPELALRIYEACRQKGVDALDAPVSGGVVGAKDGKLSIMIGGDTEVFARARPILDCYGTTIIHVGGPGKGQQTKIANCIAVVGAISGVVEALLFAQKAGLDGETTVRVLEKGAAASFEPVSYTHLTLPTIYSV